MTQADRAVAAPQPAAQPVDVLVIGGGPTGTTENTLRARQRRRMALSRRDHLLFCKALRNGRDACAQATVEQVALAGNDHPQTSYARHAAHTARAPVDSPHRRRQAAESFSGDTLQAGNP